MTLIELLIVMTIIALLAGVGMPAINSAMTAAKMNAAMQNARQVGIGLRSIAADNDGLFPGKSSFDTGEEYSNSNEVFRELIPEYIDVENVFSVSTSAWGPRADGRIDEPSERLNEGENHWAYIAGLNSTSRSDWPLVVDGTNGSGGYSTQQGDKGGAWGGHKGIVVTVGGSAKIMRLQGEDDDRFLPRVGYNEENALDLEAYMPKSAVLLDPEG